MDMPPEPFPSYASGRDRIEMALMDLPERDRIALHIFSPQAREAYAGILREAFAPQLARAEQDAETIDRLKRLVRKRRFDTAIPLREVQDVLYGEDPKR
jgi:hypothetical protein